MKSKSVEIIEAQISSGKETITANLQIPSGALDIVLFAHGSGSSRFSPRNNYVASLLNKEGIATLLIDLLTQKEEAVDEYTGQFRFNVELLANRLMDATEWLKQNQQTQKLKVGYFGASTGAAAAIIAAAKCPDEIKAVVSRGGRPDLAGESLSSVKAPTLLIVGGDDTEVIELNRQALEHIRVEKKLEVVPGATHLFEEPGTLQKAAGLAINWFKEHF